MKYLTASLLALALAPLAAPLAHADTVLFDSNSQSWTPSAGTSSSTVGGVTTITTNTPIQGAQGTPNAGVDTFSIPTITNNSGIYTLTFTATTASPGTVSNISEILGVGFGNITPLLSANSTATGSPFFSDQSQALNGGGTYYYYPTPHSGGTGLQHNITNVTPTSNIGATFTGAIILNTDTPQWTLQYEVNGQLVSFNDTTTGQTVTTLTYANNPTGINEISFGGAGQGTVAIGGVTLTETGAVAAVPEPSTWAMLMLGFAGLGLLSYRRTNRKGGSNFRVA